LKCVYGPLNKCMPNHDREGVSMDVDPSESGATIFALARDLLGLCMMAITAQVFAEDDELSSASCYGVLFKRAFYWVWIWFPILLFLIPRFCLGCSERCASLFPLAGSLLMMIGVIETMTISWDLSFTIGAFCLTLSFELGFDLVFTLLRIIFCCKTGGSTEDVGPSALEAGVNVGGAEIEQKGKKGKGKKSKGKGPAPQEVGARFER